MPIVFKSQRIFDGITTLTRRSCILDGVKRALITVTMGPSVPATIRVCPSLMLPFSRTMSMVVPRPGIALTSRTVAWSSWEKDNLLANMSCESWTSKAIKLPMPSPECADVGTMEMYVLGSARKRVKIVYWEINAKKQEKRQER